MIRDRIAHFRAQLAVACALALVGLAGCEADDEEPILVEETAAASLTAADPGASAAKAPPLAAAPDGDVSIQSIPTAGLHLWLRSDAGVNPIGAPPHAANKVSRWIDQSGNGRNASMSVAARQPTFVAGALNGQAVLRFAGAQSLGLDFFASPTTFTVFVVGKNSNPGESYSMILGPGGSAANNQMRWENGSQALFVGTGNGFPALTASVGNTRVYHALASSYDGRNLAVYRDGVLRAAPALTTSGPWVLAQVGAWYSTYFLRGDLAEIVLYDRALSDAERLTVDSYLRSKYALP